MSCDSWKMASVNFLAQNNGEGKGENNLDSSFNLHPEEPTDSEPCSPDYSPIHSSEEEDVSIQEEKEELWRYDSDPRL